MELPKPFLIRMESLLGDDFPAFLAEYDKDPVRGFHKNRVKKADLCDIGGKNLTYTEDGYIFDADKIGSHPLHHGGAFYVQEPSAMMPLSMAEGIEFPKDMRVLDVCASPGGKSSQAANLLPENGLIVSNEIAEKRCRILGQNIERLGIKNSLVTNLDSAALAKAFPRTFDLVVVDAPCSGEGMFRKNPEAVAEWSEENVTMCAARQREILTNAEKTLADGGYLIYSTCTFAPEENEENVRWFLDKYPDYALVKPSDAVINATAPGIGMEDARRFYPHIAPGEGQFAALFHRAPGNDRRELPLPAPSKNKPADLKIVRDFLRDVLGKVGENLPVEISANGRVISADGIPDILGSYMRGVKIGEIVKGRLVPDHRFFMAYGGDFVKKIEVSLTDAEKYIHGDTFPCSAFEGFGAITYKGCVLGGIKVSGGVAKNHYPKGLRKMGS